VLLGEIGLGEEIIESSRDLSVAPRANGVLENAGHKSASGFVSLPGCAINGGQ
jgi:hypothetical protein